MEMGEGEREKGRVGGSREGREGGKQEKGRKKKKRG